MDVVVTARVPSELRNQGNKVLVELGATQTQLINAAYTYLIKERKLPIVAAATSKTRTLSASDAEELRSDFQKMTFALPKDPLQGRSYKEVREDLWGERNARFA